MVNYIMNKTYITVILGICLISCSNGQENLDSEKVEIETPVEGSNEIPEHSVEFPKIESDSFPVKKKVSTPQEMPQVTQWLLEGKDENGPFMYFIAHNKIPTALDTEIQKDTNQVNTALKGMLMGSAEKLGGFDFEFKATKYNGHSGMYSKCKVFNGAGMIKSLVYLIDENIFVISGGGKGINEEKIDTFLSSFKLTE